MEMPTPCGFCGQNFDLNDGFSADVIRPNDEIICPACHKIDADYLQVKERFEEIADEIENSVETIESEKKNLKVWQSKYFTITSSKMSAIAFLKEHGLINEIKKFTSNE